MYSIIYTTVRDQGQAEALIHKLLDKRLIACANTFAIGSMYRWEGEITRDEEVGIILKTSEEKVFELRKEIEEIHPYQVPCVLVLSIESGSKAFLDWIDRETS